MDRPASPARPRSPRLSASRGSRRSGRGGGLRRLCAPLALALPVGLAAIAGGLLAGPAVGQDGGNRSAATRPHPLKKAIAYARAGQAAAERLPAYTATLRRREIVGGKPVEGVADVKFRAEPFSIYMKFTDPEAEGRQVLYVDQAHGGKMLVKEASGLKSLAGTMELATDSSLVLANSRHEITEAGLANLAGGVIERWEAESKFGEVDVRYFADAALHDRPAVVIEVTHPTPRREFRYAKTRLWMDKQTKLPVRVQNYEFRRGGGEPVLVEDYTYSDVQPAVQLTARDFDRRGYGL